MNDTKKAFYDYVQEHFDVFDMQWEFGYIAMDEDGAVYHFECEPSICDDNHFWSGPDHEELGTYEGAIGLDWKETLLSVADFEQPDCDFCLSRDGNQIVFLSDYGPVVIATITEGFGKSVRNLLAAAKFSYEIERLMDGHLNNTLRTSVSCPVYLGKVENGAINQ